MDPLFELNDKLILVSGGSRGIGKELVSGFAKRGARVVFTAGMKIHLNLPRKNWLKILLRYFLNAVTSAGLMKWKHW